MAACHEVIYHREYNKSQSLQFKNQTNFCLSDKILNFSTLFYDKIQNSSISILCFSRLIRK